MKTKICSNGLYLTVSKKASGVEKRNEKMTLSSKENEGTKKICKFILIDSKRRQIR